MKTNTIFKSEEGKQKVLAYYDQILSYFPLKQRYVQTSFGKTFVLEAGDPQNEALLLFHGSCSNSAAWLGDMPALAARFHVFAVDLLGEAGHSDENRFDLTTDAYALWIKELLDALSLQKAAIMGNSLGGWMALKFTAAYPFCVSRLVLLAAAGLAPIRAAFISQANQSRQDGSINKLNGDVLGSELPEEVRTFINLILENFIPITDGLPVLTDEQLRSLNMPVMFIAGENDLIVDAAQSAQRLTALVPQSQIHMIKNGGHLVMNVLETVMPFLMKEE